MDYSDLAYTVEPMRLEDIDEVVAIERRSFPTPWPIGAYRFELRQNPRAHYFVARPRHKSEEGVEERPQGGLWARLKRSSPPSPKGHVVGYGGFWLVAGEAHISTIAVDLRLRRRGIGQLLLASMIEKAVALGANYLTLEVRASNPEAQELYRKFGFQEVGRRSRYYSDKEDAVLMSVEELTPSYWEHFGELVTALRERLKADQ